MVIPFASLSQLYFPYTYMLTWFKGACQVKKLIKFVKNLLTTRLLYDTLYTLSKLLQVIPYKYLCYKYYIIL